MPNKNYVKGRNKEYKICRDLKEHGFEIAQRSAGSHSPIDIFAVHRKTKTILFIQAKPKNYSRKDGERINKELEYLKGLWTVEFALI